MVKIITCLLPCLLPPASYPASYLASYPASYPASYLEMLNATMPCNTGALSAGETTAKAQTPPPCRRAWIRAGMPPAAAKASSAVKSARGKRIVTDSSTTRVTMFTLLVTHAWLGGGDRAEIVIMQIVTD